MTGAYDPADDLLAAELAFGLLDAPERAAAEARAAGDPRFAALCALWQVHAQGLVPEDGEMPDPAVWAAIERRLPANDETRATSALRRSVRMWRAVSIACALVALVTGVIALRRPPAVAVAPVTVAAAAPTIVLLTGKPEAGAMAIGYDGAAGRITAHASGVTIGRHAAELWVIPADGRPRSLGVVRADVADARIEPAPLRGLITPGVTLALSVEPVGGSPTGQPTGPVILSGKVTAG